MLHGSLESDYIVPTTQKMAATLSARGYQGLELTFHILENEMYVSAIPATKSCELRALFEEG